MYSLLDVVSDAERRAESIAFDDRLLYREFLDAAERFAEQNGLIVGGAAANRLLLGDSVDGKSSGVPAPVDLKSFKYEFYSAQAVQHARALTDAMFAVDPEVRGRYATMRTKVPDASLTVDVDGRDLFVITALKVRRGVRMVDVMIPSLRPAQFAKDGAGKALMLLCSGPEIQLIEVYTALCNPAKASSWGGLLAAEAGLRAIFNNEIKAKLAEAVSQKTGGEGDARGKLVRAFRDQYAGGASRVIVGNAATALLAGAPARTGPSSHLQVVTVGRLEDEAAEITTIARRAGCEVQWTVGDPSIPIDPRLRRMSVHLIGGARRELVLEVYNAAAHELIPYTTAGALAAMRTADETKTGGSRARERYRSPELSWRASELPPGLKIGTPFAVMRFRLADMWTIQMLLRMGVVDVGYAKGTLGAMLADYNTLAAVYESYLVDENAERATERCLPLTDYIGRFEDPEVAQKREAHANAGVKFHQPYMPLLARVRTGLATAHVRAHARDQGAFGLDPGSALHSSGLTVDVFTDEQVS